MYTAAVPALPMLQHPVAQQTTAHAHSPGIQVCVDMDVQHLQLAQEELRMRKVARKHLQPGHVTQDEVIQAEMRVHAIMSQQVPQTYPGAGLAAQITNAIQVALVPFQQAIKQDLDDKLQDFKQDIDDKLQGFKQDIDVKLAGVTNSVQGLEERFELGEKRSVMRMQNALSLVDSAVIQPIPLDADSNVPVPFPRTRGALKDLLADDVIALLNTYALPQLGDHAARKKALAAFLGVPL